MRSKERKAKKKSEVPQRDIVPPSDIVPQGDSVDGVSRSDHAEHAHFISCGTDRSQSNEGMMLYLRNSIASTIVMACDSEVLPANQAAMGGVDQT